MQKLRDKYCRRVYETFMRRMLSSCSECLWQTKHKGMRLNKSCRIESDHQQKHLKFGHRSRGVKPKWTEAGNWEFFSKFLWQTKRAITCRKFLSIYFPESKRSDILCSKYPSSSLFSELWNLEASASSPSLQMTT